ncbi:MAG: Mbeg1-like protein [Polyangiaceae bacterium]
MTMHVEERRSLLARAQRRTYQGGAAMVEYSLLLFAVLICGGAAIKKVGPSVVCASANATDSLAGGIGSGGCAGATASAGGAGGSNAAATGASGSDDGTGNGVAADESGGAGAGTGSGGYIASSSSYDDGVGGFIGGSGSSNGSLGSGNTTEFDPGSAPPSSAATSVGGGGGGWGGDEGSATSSSSDNSLATNGFASQVAGTKPQQSDMTFAKLSGDVEAKHQKGADGFLPATKQQLAAAGITPSMLQDKQSGFFAAVYTNGKGDYVVAYRGTQFTSLPGPANDVAEGVGFTPRQYRDAQRLAAKAHSAFGDNLVFTGHSLGGGLAASSAAQTGLTAVTFNASGVNDNTLMSDGVNPATARAQANNGQDRNYEVTNEILSGLQDEKGSIMPQSLGRKIQSADPNPALTKFDAAISNPLDAYGPMIKRRGDLHGEFLQSLEAGPVKYQDANGKTAQFSFNP